MCAMTSLYRGGCQEPRKGLEQFCSGVLQRRAGPGLAAWLLGPCSAKKCFAPGLWRNCLPTSLGQSSLGDTFFLPKLLVPGGSPPEH